MGHPGATCGLCRSSGASFFGRTQRRRSAKQLDEHIARNGPSALGNQIPQDSWGFAAVPLVQRLTSVEQAEWAQEIGGELGAPSVRRKGQIGAVVEGHRGRAVGRCEKAARDCCGRRVGPTITTARGRPDELDQSAQGRY